MYTVDIYRIINGIYKTNALYQQIESEDGFLTKEIEQFCVENDCIHSEVNEDVLLCKFTKQPKYFIK